jgi:transcriptional regulator with XRE-family HTH domain
MGVVDFLKRELERRKQRNARYSLRAFARDLDCDHATLSQWMRGTRPMSLAAEEHLFARLDLDALERARARELDDDDLRILTAIKDRPTSTHELSASAGLTVDRANIALSKLLRLKVVRLDETNWRILEEVR